MLQRVLRRRHADMAREGDAERARRAVTHALRHFRNTDFPLAQQLPG
jgi:hypothetical protein